MDYQLFSSLHWRFLTAIMKEMTFKPTHFCCNISSLTLLMLSHKDQWKYLKPVCVAVEFNGKDQSKNVATHNMCLVSADISYFSHFVMMHKLNFLFTLQKLLATPASYCLFSVRNKIGPDRATEIRTIWNLVITFLWLGNTCQMTKQLAWNGHASYLKMQCKWPFLLRS